MEITGTSALVTGAASGLGAATAVALAGAGCRVFGLDVATAVSAAPAVDGLTYLEADVTDAVQVQHAVDVTAHAGPLRVVVNCAGIGPSVRILGRHGTHDLATFQAVLQVNLVGTFTVMTLAAAAMAQTPALPDGTRGVVVNTASIAAYDGQVGQAAYAASKGGVVSLTLTAARDLAQYGIRVMTIAPGMVETPMLATISDEFRAGLAAGVPFPPRLARPDEFASLAMHMIRNDYMNGEVVRMDGALRMAPR